MPIYKRVYTDDSKKRGVWWFSFYWNGKHIQRSTGLPVGPKENPQKARNAESEYRATLNKGKDRKADRAKELGCNSEDLIRCPQCEKLFDGRVTVGFEERKFCGRSCADMWARDHNPPPTLKEFSQRFIDSIQVRCAKKPATIRFYAEKLQTLLKFEPLANARLDHIDEALIESYVQDASKQTGRIYTEVAPATINRRLATLRRALRLAYGWKLIDRVPKVEMLKGEGNREFVLSHSSEEPYLSACPQPLRDIALTILDCGLRTSEVLNLEWCNVHLEPALGAKYGYIHIPDGKSKNARRNVPVTDRVARMLLGRSIESKSVYVFPSETGRPYRVTSIDHDHAEVRAALGMPAVFVIYSLRHSYGTRLDEAGADSFSIMKLMGHSTVTVSQRYVHPSPEALERAVERLQAMNAAKSLPDSSKPALTATIPATEENARDGANALNALESIEGV